MAYFISDTDRSQFVRKLAENDDRIPAPALPLGYSRSLDVIDVQHESWQGHFKAPKNVLLKPQDMRPLFDDITCFQLKDGQVLSKRQHKLIRGTANEMLQNAEAITNGAAIRNFNVMVYSRELSYGERLPLVQGIHVDFKPKDNYREWRRAHVIGSNIFSTICLPEMTARHAYRTRLLKPRMIAYSEPKQFYRRQMQWGRPGQYVALQELTAHAAPDVRQDFKSYDDVAKFYYGDSRVMRWCHETGYTRIFQSASWQHQPK